jgi:aspartyl-tRNA(Asn)/glutamyl-tRNA(Gln) amidotransferase subunit B
MDPDFRRDDMQIAVLIKRIIIFNELRNNSMTNNKNYQPIIGLEIHVELKTKSKMFSDCPADYFDKEPNTKVCPVSLGLPGALPVPNKKAIEWTIKICQALNCSIHKWSKFDRKHYFYPDLPKGYQISQYDKPFGYDGVISLDQKDEKSKKTTQKKFRIRRVHLEEDTGKSVHIGNDTLLDFNRSGVPLVEIVTEPDFSSSDDVKRFLEELQTIIRYLDVSDADMEKGSMRLEPNISVREIRNTKSESRKNDLPPYKVEVKNINSFNFVKKAIDYEVKRHIQILEKGEYPKQETRGYNEPKGITVAQRSKEEAQDYRYFPEPDIPPIVHTDADLENIASQIPELPSEKVERYVNEFKIRPEDAFILTRRKEMADYYEGVLSKLKNEIAKSQIKIQNEEQTIANLIINKKISTDLSVDEFVTKALDKMKPKETDMNALDEAVKKVIANNPQVVEQIKGGKENAIMFLVGQVMREMKGQAEAGVVKTTLQKHINTTK